MNDFAALNGEPVTERHTRICAEAGHATHTVDDVVSPFCPRCGKQTAKTSKPFISQAWREWLETQTIDQLNSSLAEREKVVLGLDGSDKDHMLREIEMIKEEFHRRDEAARTRADFFPRITLRNVADAQMLARLLHGHAVEVIGMSEQVLQYKRLADAGFPLHVQFVDPMTGKQTDDIDQVLQDLGQRAINAAELLGGVSEEILRLNDVEGVDLTDGEAEAFNAIVDLVQKVKEDES